MLYKDYTQELIGFKDVTVFGKYEFEQCGT